MITKITFLQIRSQSYHHVADGQRPVMGESTFTQCVEDAVAIGEFHAMAAELITNLMSLEQACGNLSVDAIQSQFLLTFGSQAGVNEKTKKVRSFSYRWLYIHQDDTVI